MLWYKLLSQFPTGPSSRNSLHHASVLNQPPTDCNNCRWAAVLQSSVSCCTFTSSTAFTDLHLPFSLLIHGLKCSEVFQPFEYLPARLLHPLTLLSRPLPHCLKLQSLHFTRQEDQHCTQQLQVWVPRGFQEQAVTPSILFSTPLWSQSWKHRWLFWLLLQTGNISELALTALCNCPPVAAAGSEFSSMQSVWLLHCCQTYGHTYSST